jgi:hypothetical protein
MRYTRQTIDRLKERAKALPAEARDILYQTYAQPVMAVQK